jgi:hypothetical protein
VNNIIVIDNKVNELLKIITSTTIFTMLEFSRANF